MIGPSRGNARKESQRYLETRAIRSPWSIGGCAPAHFEGCVVIPALAESRRLFATLHSLAQNPAPLLSRFLVLVVVNHREDAAPSDKTDNRRTLAQLREGFPPLRLAYVDAASEGLELPARTGGVGLARKIGLDLALPYLCEGGILACLDADTVVEGNYLQALCTHFARHQAGGAVIPFRHQQSADWREERAITLYELFLRHYVHGLRLARSPYAFHTVGSAMACTARAYVKTGGMNSRSAAEDFYFLQHLHKTSGLAELSGSTVHPAPRTSHRVPFGTGKSVSQIVANGEGWQTFYSLDAFRVVGAWLDLVQQGTRMGGAHLVAESKTIAPELARYLEENRFEQVWERLAANASGAEALLRAFHCWFDALKTVRLIHRLCERFPRRSAADAVPELLVACGLPVPHGEEAQLELLREVQGGHAAAARHRMIAP